ncbi:MAG: c-type cytochrome, partial [Luteitalea sp.]
AVSARVRLALGAARAGTCAQALWTLDGLDALEEGQVLQALGDASPDVQTTAVRLAERWLGIPDHPLQRAVQARLDDDAASVRHQAAASIGSLPDGPARLTALRSMLDRHGDDPIATDVALSGLRGSELTVLEAMLREPGHTPQRVAALTMLAATVLHGARDADGRQVLETSAGPDRPHWQRDALLHGAEIALLGAPMPGLQPPLPSPAFACPTCPGGRLSEGGAFAYELPVSATRGAAGGPALRLTREPAAFTALAAAGSAVAARAAAVLTRVTWPGKAGEVAAPALSAEEQQRFDAGRDLYQAMCQACHLADGRGQDRIAPSLVTSTLLLADAGIPTRILLHGKEGSVGLMPSIGTAMTDEQIAAVLTYVRREWGHVASPVEPRTVAAARAATAGRARPWTDAELATLVAPQR